METAPTSTAHGRRRGRCEMGPAPARRRAADPGDRAPDRRVPQRRAPLGADRLVRPLPQGCGSEPPRPPSPLRRGALARGPAQTPPSSIASCASTALRAVTTSFAAGPCDNGRAPRSDRRPPCPLDAAHHAVAHRRSGRAIAGGSRLHRGALPRRATAQAAAGDEASTLRIRGAGSTPVDRCRPRHRSSARPHLPDWALHLLHGSGPRAGSSRA